MTFTDADLKNFLDRNAYKLQTDPAEFSTGAMRSVVGELLGLRERLRPLKANRPDANRRHILKGDRNGL